MGVSSAPQIEIDGRIIKGMWATFFALIPAGVAGVYIFGFRAFYVILVSVLTALFTEAALQKFQGKKITISDGSASITGLLLAYNLPPAAPLWLAVVGSFFAVAIGKQLFGGLGFNIFNPALAGRAFLMASWPQHMAEWSNPRWQVDAVSTATPLMLAKEKGLYAISEIGITYKDLFLGNRGGCIGEVCILALLLGAAYLLFRKYITWHIPLTYLFTFGVLSWIFMSRAPFKGDVLFQLLCGGIMLGAFFMATDYVTAPITKKGKIVFGVGCGILNFLIRKWGGYPEGTSYAILMMNAATPVIDRFSKPRQYGFKRPEMKKKIRNGVILVIICLGASLASSLTSKMTQARLEAQMTSDEKETLGEVFAGAASFETKTLDGKTYYLAKKDQQELGYVIKAEAQGYTSLITMMIGFDKDGTIEGVAVLSQQETPGLGDRIVEIKTGEKQPWFLRQFSGRKAGELDLKNIQAITGATVTSGAVLESVKKSVAEFLAKLK
jgi:Na+-translocating ferredoxin:NAD+ oxidoreductase subunit D